MSKISTHFDYRGLDSREKQGILKKNLLLLEDELRNRYIKRLETFNKTNLEHNPEPFRFLKEENCSILAFILPIEFNNSLSMKFFFLSTPSKREVSIIILDDEDFSNLDAFLHIDEFFKDKILPKYGIHESRLILSSGSFHGNTNRNFDVFNESINLEGAIASMALNDFIINTIKKETQQFKEINQKPLSYFAKDAYKFPFSIIDLKPLIKLVNDDDFSYQLDQAMAAYHENLFLPCATTLGVVLETLCIKLLEENRIKVKSGDTQLGVLRERLMNEKIITRRDNARLEVAYKMRNIASHSSPGVALKEDCHFMLNVINTIAFEYLTLDT